MAYWLGFWASLLWPRVQRLVRRLRPGKPPSAAKKKKKNLNLLSLPAIDNYETDRQSQYSYKVLENDIFFFSVLHPLQYI